MQPTKPHQETINNNKMKIMKPMKSSLLLAALLSVSAILPAQTVHVGVKAGINNSSITYNQKDNLGKLSLGRTGAQFGLFADIRLGEHISFQPHVQYALRGGNYGAAKFRTSHIEVPLHLLYTNNGFFFGGGPSLSYALKGTIITEDEKLDLYDKNAVAQYTLKRTEFGFHFLMGYSFTGGISLMADFSPNISNIHQGNNVPNSVTSATSKSFGFSVAYMLPVR